MTVFYYYFSWGRFLKILFFSFVCTISVNHFTPFNIADGFHLLMTHIRFQFLLPPRFPTSKTFPVKKQMSFQGWVKYSDPASDQTWILTMTRRMIFTWHHPFMLINDVLVILTRIHRSVGPALDLTCVCSRLSARSGRCSPGIRVPSCPPGAAWRRTATQPSASSAPAQLHGRIKLLLWLQSSKDEREERRKKSLLCDVSDVMRTHADADWRRHTHSRQVHFKWRDEILLLRRNCCKFPVRAPGGGMKACQPPNTPTHPPTSLPSPSLLTLLLFIHHKSAGNKLTKQNTMSC